MPKLEEERRRGAGAPLWRELAALHAVLEQLEADPQGTAAMELQASAAPRADNEREHDEQGDEHREADVGGE